jgi:hypothetical protein
MFSHLSICWMKWIPALLAVAATCSAGYAEAQMSEYQCVQVIGKSALYGPNVTEINRYRLIADCAAASGNTALADELLRKADWVERQWAEKKEKARKAAIAHPGCGSPQFIEDYPDLCKKFAALDAYWDHEKKCAAGKPEIGMTKDEAVRAWCQPWTINTTETTAAVREQWVYGRSDYIRGYLYFENGRLVAIQRRN